MEVAPLQQQIEDTLSRIIRERNEHLEAALLEAFHTLGGPGMGLTLSTAGRLASAPTNGGGQRYLYRTDAGPWLPVVIVSPVEQVEPYTGPFLFALPRAPYLRVGFAVSGPWPEGTPPEAIYAADGSGPVT